MSDLKIREDKIKEKKRETDYRQFIKQIASWQPVVFNNIGMISRYPKSGRIGGVINFKEFEESRDSLTDKGMDYDFNKTFFENFQGLMRTIDFPNIISFFENENADFTDIVISSKNVYLSFIIIHSCENIVYSCSIKDNCRNVINSVMARDSSENIYMSNGIVRGYNVFYSKFLYNCSNIWFSSNLVGCNDCMFCNDLENKSYCFKNQQYTKEEYNKLKAEKLREKGKFMDWYMQLDSRGNNLGSENIKGNFIVNSHNIENGNYIYLLENARNVLLIGSAEGNKNFYDVISGGSPGGNDFYGVTGAGTYVENLYNSTSVNGGANVFYGHFLENCTNMLGCIGLKNKEFCILNKQYGKDDWYEMVDKIFSQMEKDGIFGQFFPGSLCPYNFNDTIANYILEFDKEKIKKAGYLRRDDEVKVDIPGGSEIISAIEGAAYMLPVTGTIADYQGFDEEGNWKINPEIMKKVILDKDGNYYRIVKMEYDFLMKHGLPIPEIHWLDRIKLGFKFN